MSDILLLWSKSPNTATVNRSKIIQNEVDAYLDFDDDIDVRLWQSNC
jgi:hypothetical protein